MRVQPRPAAPALGGRPLRELPRGRRVRARDLPVGPASRPTAACSTPARPRLTMAGDGSHALLVLGFESTDHPVEERWSARSRSVRRARRRGLPERRRPRRRGDARRLLARGVPRRPLRARRAGRDGRARRDVRDGDHVGALRGLPRARDAPPPSRRVREALRREGSVFCRFTHVYPDGPAPYFTVLAPGRARRGGRAVGRDQARGRPTRSSPPAGTITHHHAVGRDHRPVV